MMTPMSKRFALPALAAVFALAGTVGARAYTYHFEVPKTTNLTKVWMHTVSVFCHDVNWSGTVAPGGTLSLSSASICLVDGVQVWGSAGMRSLSLPIGVSGGTFYIDGSGNLGWKP